jgi:hypothetical protein
MTIAVIWRSLASSLLLLLACAHPATMKAAPPSVPAQVAPAAPPEPPVQLAAVEKPARVAEAPPFDVERVLAAIEEHGVRRLESARHALYVEHAAGRSLCLYEPAGAPRCFCWPDAYRAPFHIERWNEDDTTELWFDEADTSGVLRVSTTGRGLSVRRERIERCGIRKLWRVEIRKLWRVSPPAA